MLRGAFLLQADFCYGDFFVTGPTLFLLLWLRPRGPFSFLLVIFSFIKIGFLSLPLRDPFFHEQASPLSYIHHTLGIYGYIKSLRFHDVKPILKLSF